MTPSEASLRGQLAAHTRWSRTEDRHAATAPARQGLEDKYWREVEAEHPHLSHDVKVKLVRSRKSADAARRALKRWHRG